MQNIRSMVGGCLVLTVLMFIAGRASAGNLDSPAAPTNPASAMFTLEDLYQKLDKQSNAVATRAGGFVDPASGPTSGTFRTVGEIMALVTNRAPVVKNGEYQYGITPPSPRFELESASGVGTNCVVDHLTGLTWARDANIASNLGWGAATTGKVAWAQAFDVITNGVGGVNALNYGGHNDWRLPNVSELYSFRDSDPFILITNRQTGCFWWTSTTYAKSGTTNAWYSDLATLVTISKTNICAYVLPVRGGK